MDATVVRQKLIFHALVRQLEAEVVSEEALAQYLSLGGSELSLAAIRGEEEMVQVLLMSGAEANAADCLGVTALYQAAMRGYADIVRHLAHAGADVNAVVSDGTTALLQAAYVGSVDEPRRDACATVVAVLRELGADATAKDCWGKSAADYCHNVPELEVAIGSDVLVQCPYLDCSRTYRVRRRDFRCRIVRCGAALCRGREYQLPKHGTREQVRNWLQESWGWDDWPGEVLGCGRPFRFPDDSGTGLFVTWADEITGELHPSSVDVTGDYSIATGNL